VCIADGTQAKQKRDVVSGARRACEFDFPLPSQGDTLTDTAKEVLIIATVCALKQSSERFANGLLAAVGKNLRESRINGNDPPPRIQHDYSIERILYRYWAQSQTIFQLLARCKVDKLYGYCVADSQTDLGDKI